MARLSFSLSFNQRKRVIGGIMVFCLYRTDLNTMVTVPKQSRTEETLPHDGAKSPHHDKKE
jgi:hypothetical protein